MFDIGMSELLIIGVVALIVVGPKDLPGMFRTLGRFTAKIKAMGREFTRAMEAAADDAGVNDIKGTLNAAANPAKFGLGKLKEAATDFEQWDPMKVEGAAPTKAATMDEERTEMARQINEATAAKATARKAAEATAETATVETAATTSAKAKPTAAKTPAKKTAAKKAPAKKAAAKKPAAKTAAAKKASTKTATTKTAATKTTTAKKTTAKKTEDKA